MHREVVFVLLSISAAVSAAVVPGFRVLAEDVDAAIDWKAPPPTQTTVEDRNELVPRSVVGFGPPVKPPKVGAIPTFRPAAGNPFSRTNFAFTPLRTPTISFPVQTKPPVNMNSITAARVQEPDAEAPTFSLSIPSISIPSAEAKDEEEEDESGTVRGLIIALSIVSVFLALAIITCIYLARKMKHQKEYYEEQLAGRRVGEGVPGYQPQYVEVVEGDQVPLVAYEEKHDEVVSRRSSVSFASSGASHRD